MEVLEGSEGQSVGSAVGWVCVNSTIVLQTLWSNSCQSQSPFGDREQGTRILVPCQGNKAVQSQTASKVHFLFLLS